LLLEIFAVGVRPGIRGRDLWQKRESAVGRALRHRLDLVNVA